MQNRNWWQRLMSALTNEYERRIRRASLVTEYGAAHHDPTHHDDEGEVAEIVNLPRGTRVTRQPSVQNPE